MSVHRQDVALLMADEALKKRGSTDLAHLAMRWAFPSLADGHPCECTVCTHVKISRFHYEKSVDLTTLADNEHAHSVPPYGWIITAVKS